MGRIIFVDIYNEYYVLLVRKKSWKLESKKKKSTMQGGAGWDWGGGQRGGRMRRGEGKGGRSFTDLRRKSENL